MCGPWATSVGAVERAPWAEARKAAARSARAAACLRVAARRARADLRPDDAGGEAGGGDRGAGIPFGRGVVRVVGAFGGGVRRADRPRERAQGRLEG
jgi:hypothetical protein